MRELAHCLMLRRPAQGPRDSRLDGFGQRGKHIEVRWDDNGDVTGIESINAITLRTAQMATSVGFYEALGFTLSFGGRDASFSTLSGGHCFVNLIAVATPGEAETGWGRVIFHVDDVDAIYERALDAGLSPQEPPIDAPWGERMFAIFDPSGHDLSFAKRIRAYDVDHPAV